MNCLTRVPGREHDVESEGPFRGDNAEGRSWSKEGHSEKRRSIVGIMYVCVCICSCIHLPDCGRKKGTQKNKRKDFYPALKQKLHALP